MTPRNNAVDAKLTRERIVQAAVMQASVEGLGGLTLGVLAQEVGLSKAGVVGPFGSKEGLQLAALERAIELFRTEVWLPVANLAPGVQRLRGACEHWIRYLERRRLPGGCFITTAAVEWDARRGVLRDTVARAQQRWLDVLAADIALGVAAGELSRDTDPTQLAFELNGLAMSLNQQLLLFENPTAPAMARRAVARLTQDPNSRP